MTARTERYSSRVEPSTIPMGMASAAAMPSPSAQPWIVFHTASQNPESPS